MSPFGNPILRPPVPQLVCGWGGSLNNNTFPCSSSGLSPFQCAYGYQPPLLPEVEPEVGVLSVQALFVNVVGSELEPDSFFSATWPMPRGWWIVVGPLLPPTIQLVWLSICHLPLHVESQKLAPCFIGPFLVSKVGNPAAVWLQLPRAMMIHLKFHFGCLKPASKQHFF